MNNPDFESYLGQMYPAEIEIKDTTEMALLLPTWIYMYSCRSGGTASCALLLYDKRDDFNFHIKNFPFLSINIQSSQTYGVFISQLIQYARASSSY